ncbi:MAG: anhydro-N-acetylmuramic acid kinase, partial [Clostridiales bacterium]|nr:anhydro-N-acetylmuramic acid kinase [Clostridiales bacterium]
ATATAYTARTMRRNYDLYVFPRCPDLKRIVLGGGGAHNATLRAMIQDEFPQQLVQTQEDLGWNSDAKEALAFALIARETIHKRNGNIPSATGASRAVPLGCITYPPRP